MGQLSEASISCPYCGEVIPVLIDASVEEQNYIEDCQVCCQPILFQVTTHPGEEPRVDVRRENE